MTNSVKQVNKHFAVLFVFASVILLAFVLSFVLGCSPSQNSEISKTKSEQTNSGDATASQKADWSMQSDCASCHTTEAQSMSNEKCPQAVAHTGTSCTTCHTDESVLKNVHQDITLGDKPAKKATVETVDPQSCITCHGDFDAMASKTAESKALTDSNGTSANPHELRSGKKHEENPPTCISCHNTHSESLSKDSMKFCANCHHRGVFTCGNCHAVD